MGAGHPAPPVLPRTGATPVSCVHPPDFVTEMIDSGGAEVFMSTRDALIRAFMAGTVLALTAAFAVTVTVQTGQAVVGALLLPVGFCLLSLLGLDLLTGVLTSAPPALIGKRPGVTVRAMLGDRTVPTGVVAAMLSTIVSGRVVAVWLPILLSLCMDFEHSVADMTPFPSGLVLGGGLPVVDHLVRNEIPTVLGDLAGGPSAQGSRSAPPMRGRTPPGPVRPCRKRPSPRSEPWVCTSCPLRPPSPPVSSQIPPIGGIYDKTGDSVCRACTARRGCRARRVRRAGAASVAGRAG